MTAPTDKVFIRRVLPARRRLVFEAWTRPELMARWFFPEEDWKATVSADVSVGGHYQLVMRDAGGAEHTQFGEYREIVPVSRLVFTWSCPNLGVLDSVVTVELTEKGTTTELQLTHELPSDPKILRGHEDGWKGCLGNLERFMNNNPEWSRK